jgi:hypothetical protein
MELSLKLDKFAGNTNIVHRFDLDEKEDCMGYNMIIGRDLLNDDLNIDVRFSDNTIKWEDQLVAMKSFAELYKNKYPMRKELNATILRSAEPISTNEATDRAVKILDSNYEPADLDKVVTENKSKCF